MKVAPNEYELKVRFHLFFIEFVVPSVVHFPPFPPLNLQFLT